MCFSKKLTKSFDKGSLLEDLLGSTAKSAVGDTVLSLYREKGRQEATLKIVGCDLEEQELALYWDAAACRWQPKGEAEITRKSDIRQEILAAIPELETLGELPTGTSIAQYIDRNRTNVVRELTALEKEKLIIKCEKQN